MIVVIWEIVKTLLMVAGIFFGAIIVISLTACFVLFVFSIPKKIYWGIKDPRSRWYFVSGLLSVWFSYLILSYLSANFFFWIPIGYKASIFLSMFFLDSIYPISQEDKKKRESEEQIRYASWR